MSVSTLFLILCCLSFYKLGSFNARRPGQLVAWGKILWQWINQ